MLTHLNILEMTLLIALGAMLAGFLGSLTGLGGGVVIVPMLHVFFGVDLHYAIGTALVSVIATSSGAAAAYVKEGYSNVRVGMFLEIATTIGALVGAYLENLLPTQVIAIIFGLVLALSSWLSSRSRTEAPETDVADPLAVRLRMDGTFPTPEGLKAYHVHGVPGGFAVMFIAGTLSGLLGIGSGALKVLAMDQVMRLPFKVSTTTSNFMIGVTAAASAGIYLHRGQIVPGLAFPVVIGVLAGAFLGTRVLVRARVRALRIVFSIVILALAAWMIYSAVTGG
jgi:uncharacterized membrane protein YfcA